MSARVLIVAIAARALARAAVRAGYTPAVLDMFGDADTRQLAATSAVVAGSLDRGFDGDSLMQAVERLAPARSGVAGVIYGSGFESCPELLQRLAEGRRLWGNRPDVLQAIKEPSQFFPLLDRLNLPRPEISSERPTEGAWLSKSIGASGGSHIRSFATATDVFDRRYYQRYVAGIPVSCLFLANGRRAVALGWSEQWTVPTPVHPFRFGGAVQPVRLPSAVMRQIETALPKLVRYTGLLGLNSLDMMVEDSGDLHVLEVNPRPGATLDIFDGEGPHALLGLHIAACEGKLDSRWQPPPQASAMAIVYAERLLRVRATLSYPAWSADRPTAGTRIEAGAPVCTVTAEAADAESARRLVLARSRDVLDAFVAKEAG